MHQEYQYLNVLKNILENGKPHKNRTGVETRRLLCEVMKFDLSEEFPLLTTKKMHWKGIMHELLWFLSGDTNIKYLQDNGVHIWDANAKDYWEKKIKPLKERKDGAPYVWFDFLKEGDLGPVYGAQWRNFNGTSGVGFDQIKWAENEIKYNQESRRIIISAWNPLEIPNMALPPCHVLFQFSVDEDRLHCTMYQRSCDEFLGIPYNIASYSLLTCMMASANGLKPGTLNHIMNDAHIYGNHIDQVKEQLSRTPYPFPQLKLNSNVKSILDFKPEDINLINYQSHPAIKAEMAV